ncbi:Retrovirus-related Pol poly from transposon [Paramuricea clavata]|uniref:Retrovirus-related Pol poly from transposon n=1 Tax=Paramuricea clavata TaxID=317549 RepID=A0A7D9DVW8_PARCT|nr:Retrovirus-related Pol poly from transposon [Paramuricea clavata]
MRLPNRAIHRERHPSPTVDDIIHSLNGAKKFSKLDLRSGYHQFVLAPESRHITTFATHKGMLDDIIIFGNTTAEHDKALKEIFHRLSDKGLTLNPDKCVFDKENLDFFGYTFGPAGMKPDPKKVLAIHDATPPTNTAELHSFLSTVNYVSCFIYDFSAITAPLCALTPQQHRHAFDELKRRLTTSPTMAYFNPAKDTELVVDASPVGLGAILTQKTSDSGTNIVAYASRSMSPVEQRYSQTEHEALACVWGCEKFHLYVYGAPFTLITDNIFNNPKAKPPARLERWNLRLQPYNFTVRYEPGKTNPANYISRNPLQNQPLHEHNIAEEYVSLLTTSTVLIAMTLAEIQDATLKDPTLRKLAEIIRSQQWHSVLDTDHSCPNDKDKYNLRDLKAFHKIRHELTVTTNNDIILRGSRIVMPTTLRRRALELAHERHQGLIKTKRLLREKIWFPRIDQQAEEMIKYCLPCQAANPESKLELLKMSPLPLGPWQNVAADFYDPLPTGQTLMVVIDEYSRFVEVEIVSSTSAAAAIPKLDKIFATHGIPDLLKTDNGPPFTNHAFKVFATELGFKHTGRSHHYGQRPMQRLNVSCVPWEKPFALHELNKKIGRKSFKNS